jgi:ribosomal protein S18 acetylase RimI-like enzyme
MFFVQRCTLVDDALAEAWRRLMPQLNPAAQPPDLAALQAILSGGATELFTAREQRSNRIVGVLALVVFSTPTGTHSWIEDVVVDENYRGQGIGSMIIRAAIERARERGAKAVDLTSRPVREAANRLYLRMGFVLRQSNLYRFNL